MPLPDVVEVVVIVSDVDVLLVVPLPPSPPVLAAPLPPVPPLPPDVAAPSPLAPSPPVPPLPSVWLPFAQPPARTTPNNERRTSNLFKERSTTVHSPRALSPISGQIAPFKEQSLL